jgi:2-(1,2-epoxy-1,2-dihydrophenyl)acetyl-CoA isomerase
VTDLIESISEGVATLMFNRPERLNALSTPITSGLLEALPRLARDDSVGAVVLTGAGRAFCAGGDVKNMAEGSVEQPLEEAYLICAAAWKCSGYCTKFLSPRSQW